MYGFDGLSGRRERGPWYTRSIQAALLTYAVCGAVFGAAYFALIWATAGAALAVGDLFAYLLALGVGAPFAIWVVAAPLSALGRYLARVLGGHRVLWTVLALAVLLVLLWLLSRPLMPAAVDTTLTVLVLVMVGPCTVVHSALRTEERVAQNRRWQGR